MPEENQNMGKSVSQLNTSSLRDWANSMIDFQKQARQEQMAKASVESDNSIKNLMVSWMTTTNHWVSQDCDRAARIWLVAQWIRQYFALPENWWTDYSNVPDVDLVNSYKDSNPDSEEAIWQFVLDDSQICDPNPLYQELGFYWEPQVEEEISETIEEEWNPRVEAWTNIAWAVTESVLWLPKFVWKESADIAAWTLKLFWWDEEKANAAAEEVKSFIDKISFWNEDSLLYKWTKISSDLVLAYLLWKWLFPQTNIGNLWWGTKSLLGAAEWAWDMALYSMISEQESPSKWDINIGMWLWWFLPYLWLLWRWWKDLIKWLWKKEIENAIPKVSKLSEGRQDSFLKDFWITFEEWMNERWLITYKDVQDYFNASKWAKLDALKQIKWRYKAKEVDDVLDWCVDYAQKTWDPRLEELIELQTKNSEWGLEMWESEKVKQYFWDKWVFNFKWEKKSSEEIDTLTNMYENLMNWQRKVAEENWFWNLADINNEIQAGWYLNRYVRDMTKIWKKWMSLLDFAIAVSTWDWKAAATFLISKRILTWPKVNEKYAKLLQWMFKNWKADKLAVDYEKIQSIQDEKELMKWIEENYWVAENALPSIEWVKSVPTWTRPTILEWWETIIWTPEWKSVIKDTITEIPQSTK